MESFVLKSITTTVPLCKPYTCADNQPNLQSCAESLYQTTPSCTIHEISDTRKNFFFFKNLILDKYLPVVLILTCSRAANKYTAIKMGVNEVCPLFIKWMVYKNIRCPGITKRSRTWADLLFTPTIKKKKKSKIWLSSSILDFYSFQHKNILISHFWNSTALATVEEQALFSTRRLLEEFHCLPEKVSRTLLEKGTNCLHSALM